MFMYKQICQIMYADLTSIFTENSIRTALYRAVEYGRKTKKRKVISNGVVLDYVNKLIHYDSAKKN